MIVCTSPASLIMECQEYVDLLRSRGLAQDRFMALLGVRGEVGVAVYCGKQALASEYAQLRSPRTSRPLYDFDHNNLLIDVKTRMLDTDRLLSDWNDERVTYVFCHAHRSSLKQDISAFEDMKFVIDGWCNGKDMVAAEEHLRARWECPPEKLRPFLEIVA